MLMRDADTKPSTVFVELSYRGVDADNSDVYIVHRSKFKLISDKERQWLKRRKGIEPLSVTLDRINTSTGFALIARQA